MYLFKSQDVSYTFIHAWITYLAMFTEGDNASPSEQKGNNSYLERAQSSVTQFSEYPGFCKSLLKSSI